MPARLRFLTVSAVVLLLIAASTHAQTPVTAPAPQSKPAAAPKLDAATRNRILDSLSVQMLANYVEADTARLIVDKVRARQKAGAYDQATSPLDFGELVTSDMRSINGDLHLSLRYDPGQASASGPMMVRRAVGAGGPGAPPSGGAQPVRRGGIVPGALERNFGLTNVEILPGNIGYLEVTGFLEAPGYEDAMAAALQFLARTDAVIIDVRRNGGGSGIMSHMLFSHFLAPEPVRTINVKSRIEGWSREMSSFDSVPGPRRPDVPLAVLTSRNTGSAAEEFSFVLHNLGRARLYGDRTAGAGHMVQTYRLPDDFAVGVSITRVSDPKTGLEWEAVGVQPDVRVAPDRALAVAHVAAVRAIAEKSDDAKKKAALELLASWIEAKDARRPVKAEDAARFAGVYEGDRRVRNVDGRLMLQRGEGPADELVSLGDGTFAFNGDMRVRFGTGSPASNLQYERPDGTILTMPRVMTSLKVSSAN